MKKIRIAIDGPAGAGKSSVSRLTAERLGYSYIDTGAIYRSLAFSMGGTDVENHSKIRELLKDFEVSFKIIEGVNHVFLNGNDVTSEIRTEAISMKASSVSAIPFVREALFNMQRKYAENGGVVMEGRDIGTVIMPDAELKIFLTASPEKRAKRRMLELEAKGQKVNFDELVREIRERDINDSTRAVSPLKQADDAVLLDNSGINLEQTVDIIVKYAKEREAE
jgi:cytidylate kinase